MFVGSANCGEMFERSGRGNLGDFFVEVEAFAGISRFFNGV